MILPLLDNCMEANIRDYIDMVLDYLCLRQWAEVQLGKVSSTVKKEIKKNKKTQVITEPGLDYYLFDSNGTLKYVMKNVFRLVAILDYNRMVMVREG